MWTVVTSREGRVSRNIVETVKNLRQIVTSREGRVSRNLTGVENAEEGSGHVPRGACE